MGRLAELPVTPSTRIQVDEAGEEADSSTKPEAAAGHSTCKRFPEIRADKAGAVTAPDPA